MKNLFAAAAFLLGLVFPAFADDTRIMPSTDPAGAVPLLISTAAENSHVFKTSKGNLYYLSAVNIGAAGFILLIDGSTVPVDGALSACNTTNAAGCLKACAPIAIGSTTPVFLNVFQAQAGAPIPFVNGIVAVYSSTGCFTKTAGTASVTFEAQPY